MNMDFKSAKELLDLCEENQLPISEVMRQRGNTPPFLSMRLQNQQTTVLILPHFRSDPPKNLAAVK